MTPYELERNEHEKQPEQPTRHHGPTKPSSQSVSRPAINSHVASAPGNIGRETTLMQSMFRSVSMMEPSTAATVRFSRHEQDTTKTPSPATIEPLLPKKAPTYRKAKSSPAAVHTPPQPVWNVQTLQGPPIYYPLEKTAITIQCSLTSLTQQIADFLKEHSISSVYHDSSARVDCMTPSLLHFSVQLWKGNEPAAGNIASHPSVIVEIQRRQGCCIEMQRMRQEMIHHLTDPKSRETAATITPTSSSVHVLQQLVEQSTHGTKALPPLTMEDFDNAYRIAFRLLKSERFDERRLGLESLHVLANAHNVMIHQAHFVSSKILTDPDIESLLVEYFVNVKIDVDESNDDDDSMHLDDRDETMNYARGRFFGAMHILALKVVTNALDTAVYCGKTQGLEKFDVIRVDLATPFWNHVLPAMLYNMHISHARPLEACLSVRSFRRLHTLAPGILKERLEVFADHAQLDHFLTDARSFGRQHYLQLELETMQFMNQLGLAF
jgi:hypothetical protein